MKHAKCVAKYILGLSVLLLIVQVAFGQKAIPPQSARLVNDYAGMMSRSEQNALERKLVAYNDSTSTQIAVVIDRSLEGENIFDYSQRLAESWGIGQGEKDNGILIYVAQQDRQLRIQVGYGAEGFLPDAMANRIINEVITPAFKAGNYYQGLDQATDVIFKLASGEYTTDNINRSSDMDDMIPLMIVLALVLLVFFLASRGGGDDDDDGGYYRGGRYERRPRGRRGGGGWIFLPGGGGGGWDIGGGGGGGFGGGGFGGFGGGSFGGGGAGGSW
ncbi:MAG: TPM domain-containing protein [Bacteroidota bacterium]